MEKTILKTFLVFIFGVFVFVPNIIMAESEQPQACRNSYVSNVLPGANSKIESFKYFLVGLKKDVDQDSVKFYINGEEQDVNVVKKANDRGYFGIVKADQSLSKTGTLLLKISASGSNENKCDDDFFVGLEMVKPTVSQNTGSDLVVIPQEAIVTGEAQLPEDGEQVLEEDNELLLGEGEDLENQTASVSDAPGKIIQSLKNDSLFLLVFLLIIVVLLVLLLKKKKKQPYDHGG